MKRIAIDTNIYSNFKRFGSSHLLLPLRAAEYIGISVVVIGELLGGFKCGGRAQKNLDDLDQFLESPRVFVNDIDQETAAFYSDIYKRLRDKGKPVPSNDMWIAASAMQNGLALLTLDDHFEWMDGLSLIRLPKGS